MKPGRTVESESRREIALPENSPLRFTKAKGLRVTCVSGIVLITAYGQQQDVELHPGEQFVVPNKGLALVEGIGCSDVIVDQANTRPHPLCNSLPIRKLIRLREMLESLRDCAFRAWVKRY